MEVRKYKKPAAQSTPKIVGLNVQLAYIHFTALWLIESQ